MERPAQPISTRITCCRSIESRLPKAILFQFILLQELPQALILGGVPYSGEVSASTEEIVDPNDFVKSYDQQSSLT